MSIRTDGSALADAQRVEIDLEDERDRWRFRCPNNHTTWSRTNNHIWCQGCSRAGVDPEHYEVVDKRSGEEVPWSAVVVK